MEHIISKELLSKIWGQEVTKIDKQCTMWDMDILPFWSFEPERYEGGGKNEKRFCIALEVIAHKCKEWAYKQGFSVYATQYIIDEGGWCLYVYADNRSYDYSLDITCYTFKTEYEAIFKACQWILDNKDQQ